MNYFFKNFFKGAANINILFTGQNNLNEIENEFQLISKRAKKEKTDIALIIKKQYFEQILGQIITFILCLSFLLLTLIMVSLKISDGYCLIPIVISQIILFGPKIIFHYVKKSENNALAS